MNKQKITRLKQVQISLPNYFVCAIADEKHKGIG